MKFNFNSFQLKFIKELTNIDASGDLNDEQEKKIKTAVKSELFGSFNEKDLPTETTLLCDAIIDLIYDTKKAHKIKNK